MPSPAVAPDAAALLARIVAAMDAQQWRRSWLHPDGAAPTEPGLPRYRSADGCVCPLGALLPPYADPARIEGQTIGRAIVMDTIFGVGWRRWRDTRQGQLVYDFLWAAQLAHDTPRLALEEELRAIANRLRIPWPKETP